MTDSSAADPPPDPPSPTRAPLVVANWKMNLNPPEAAALARAVAGRLRREVFPPRTDEDDGSALEVGLAPAFPALTSVRDGLYGSPLRLVAQDLFPEPDGAFTGAVSATMVAACGCSMALVGHSERRRVFGDTDETARRKAEAALAAGLDPILCVGETEAQRDGGEAEAVVAAQLRAALEGAPEAARPRFTLAYEPVWAIGAGRAAAPETAAGMHAAIRAETARLWGEAAAEATRILYGGSVNGDNAAAFLDSSEVDGLLVGGASLTADSFIAICAAAAGEPQPPDSSR